jgi:hypothetical protein
MVPKNRILIVQFLPKTQLRFLVSENFTHIQFGATQILRGFFYKLAISFIRHTGSDESRCVLPLSLKQAKNVTVMIFLTFMTISTKNQLVDLRDVVRTF